MAHLTLGELTGARTIYQDHRDGVRRVQQLRYRPGYGESMLRQYDGVVPPDVLDAEIRRIRAIQDRGLAPAAHAWTQLARAYQDDDVEAIRRWEASLDRTGARRYLNAVQARQRSQNRRFFGINGMSGLG